MIGFSKSLVALAVASTALASVPSHAFTISFGGARAFQDNVNTVPVDSIGAGLTSSVAGYINAGTNTVTGADVYLETFDAKATGLNPFGYTTRPTDGNLAEIQFGGPNGGFTSLNPNTVASGGDLTIANGTGRGMGIRTGSLSGVAAAPGGACSQGGSACNDTYYAYGPGQGGAMPTTVSVDYTTLLGAYGPGFGIDYLGVFYGSIDTYNGMRFRDSSNNLIAGSGVLADGILTGTEILTALGGASGNQTSLNSNVYVNLSFAPGEQFTSFEFYTTAVAIEIDNVVTHIGRGQVPEPGSMALVGLGLLGLAGMRRRKA